MLIMLNNGQKNSVSVCGHLSLSNRIRISYCTSGIDFLNLNNLGQSLSFPARECSADVLQFENRMEGSIVFSYYSYLVFYQPYAFRRLEGILK